MATRIQTNQKRKVNYDAIDIEELEFIPLADSGSVSICFHGGAINKLIVTTEFGAKTVLEIQKQIKEYIATG